MTDFTNKPVFHPKLQSASLSHHSSHWHPYAGPSTPVSPLKGTTRMTTSEANSPRYTGSTSEHKVNQYSQKVRRSGATACDSCRLRKHKCDAKDLPAGTACSACCRTGIECTFVDKWISAKSNLVLSESPLADIRAYRETPSYPASAPPVTRKGYDESRSFLMNEGRPRRSNDRHFDEGWGHEQAGVVLASINSGSLTSPNMAVWDRWNIPLFLTNPSTGQRRMVTSRAVVELLVHRFYDQPSFNCIVVPSFTLMLNRLRQGTVPPHLLHTIIACAAASSLAIEPELLLWRSQVWHGASESIHQRLTISGPPELELVQSLLLLSTNWSGGLLQIERVNTFHTAIDLALSLQLHSGEHLCIEPGPRSTRIMLFWSFYCTDKIMSVITRSQPVICTESHSIPLPSLEDIEEASDLSPGSTVAAWLHRLASAYITLSQITECVQLQLLLPIRQGKLVILEEIHQQMMPLEKKLESFCKEHRWLLSIVAELSPLCRSLAEAVISQLHFTQLHLYLPALQFEVDRREKLDQPLQFSARNDKPLAATIESAWHLVQQPINKAPPDLSSLHTQSDNIATSLQDQNASLTFSHACVLIGLNFFKFLSTNWADWDQGRGCVRNSSIQLSQHFLRNVDSLQEMPKVHPRGTLREVSPNEERPIRARPNALQEKEAYPQGQQQGEHFEARGNKKHTFFSSRHNLPPLHIAQRPKDVEVDSVATSSPVKDMRHPEMKSIIMTTPARALFKDASPPITDQSPNNRREEEIAFARLSSRTAMLKQSQPNDLQEFQEPETGQGEDYHTAKALGRPRATSRQ